MLLLLFLLFTYDIFQHLNTYVERKYFLEKSLGFSG